MPLPHHIKIFNDTVMGGRSNSQVRISNQVIHFSGEVSLANNGGFASMRSQWPWVHRPMTSQQIDTIQITVQGDGKRYQFRLFTADNSDGSAYVYDFETVDKETTVITIALSVFSARFRGCAIQKPDLKLDNILEYGLLIGDKQVGCFSLCFKGIELIGN